MHEDKNADVIKANGEREAFDPFKTFTSLKNSGADDDVANKVVAHIQAEVKDGMTTHDIYKRAFALLHKNQRPLAVRYSLKRSLMDLGPSGFPFEKFVAEIFRKKGYHAVTDQIVQGHCTEHEVDVVAYDDKELVMCEAKFHNESGGRSDLKIALYVKARFDDLKEATFEYGDKERKLTRGILITNTKFTTTAIRYAECKGLEMIGWNYPKKGSLLRMIEDSGLHPVTCLTTLTGAQKKELMQDGMVLCSKVRENHTVLKKLGLNDEEIKGVVDETNLLCPVF
jgi:hypothetical protein